MNKKNVLLTGILTVCLAASMCAYADSKDDSQNNTWVGVSLFDGRKSSVVEYYGVMDKTTFNGITGNTLTNGFFKLDNTSWMTDEGIKLMRDSQSSGRSRGYSGETHMLINAIMRIVKLDDEFIKSELAPRFK